MNHLNARLAGLILLFAGTLPANGQAITTGSASHDVTLEVLEISTISLADANVSLIVDADDAPSAGTATYSEEATTSYALSTNGNSKKVIGSLDVAPSKGQLTVNLTAPSVGSGRGTILLDTTPKDLVIDVARVSGSGLGMQYVYTVNVSEGTMASETKTVTYTIMDA